MRSTGLIVAAIIFIAQTAAAQGDVITTARAM